MVNVYVVELFNVVNVNVVEVANVVNVVIVNVVELVNVVESVDQLMWLNKLIS